MTDCLMSMFNRVREEYAQADWLWYQFSYGRISSGYVDENGFPRDGKSTKISVRDPFNRPLPGHDGKRIEAPLPELPPLDIENFRLDNWYFVSGRCYYDGSSQEALKRDDKDTFILEELKSLKEEILKFSRFKRTEALFEYNRAVYNYCKREDLLPRVYSYLRTIWTERNRTFEIAKELHSQLKEYAD